MDQIVNSKGLKNNNNKLDDEDVSKLIQHINHLIFCEEKLAQLREHDEKEIAKKNSK